MCINFQFNLRKNLELHYEYYYRSLFNLEIVLFNESTVLVCIGQLTLLGCASERESLIHQRDIISLGVGSN